ncbi:MAG: aminotransferase class [Conexibacter sp.]|nr:aminotransferase class [Conexibacter sp.]
MSAAEDGLATLRARFPVLSRLAYLNAGTNGPVPLAATAAACDELRREEDQGRGGLPHVERQRAHRDALRSAYAARLGAAPADVALTTSTTDGIGRVLSSLDLQPGDEVLTSVDEHPGVYGPLAGLRARGIEVRTAPFAAIADAAGPRTRLVVCSHVSWISGALAPAALRELDAPVLLDGAQGVGAVAIDVAALGADAYAGSGQKWLCGPDGSGMLYVSPSLRERLRPLTPGYLNLADASAGLDSEPARDARAYDTPALPSASLAHALAALETLGAAGWDAVLARAHALAERAADALRERGRQVLGRDRTTLVAWREDDPQATVERLAAAGVVVRPLPGGELVRASVGGWSNDDDLDRLLAALR